MNKVLIYILELTFVYDVTESFLFLSKCVCVKKQKQYHSKVEGRTMWWKVIKEMKNLISAAA